MAETDAEFVERITGGADARKVIEFSKDAIRLFALARRGAAAGDLLEALTGATAALVAAHSLLVRGGKKAAPSNKMFAQMLMDYQKSIDISRAAIARFKALTTQEKDKDNGTHR